MNDRLSIKLLAASALLATGLSAPLAAYAGTVIMRDDFSSKSSGWADNSEATKRGHTRGFGIYTDTGSFQMTPIEENTMGIMPAPKQAASGDVRISSDMFVFVAAGSGAGGLVCRAQDFKNFYAFIVSGNGGWSIIRARNGEADILAKGSVPNQVTDGQVDTKIAVECDGDALRMSLDGKRMGEARDSTFTNGESGLFVVGETLVGANVDYDNFVLEQLR